MALLTLGEQMDGEWRSYYDYCSVFFSVSETEQRKLQPGYTGAADCILK